MKSTNDLSFPPAFVRLFFKSFLTAYALCEVFRAPLDLSWYETDIDYVIASVYELLGKYDIRFLLVLIITFAFYHVENRKQIDGMAAQKKSSRVLSVFLAFCLLVGQSYNAAGTSEWCFGSMVNFVKFVLTLAGFSILFHSLITWFYFFLETHDFTAGKEHFFSRHTFRKAFLIIFGSYLPFLLLSFPGNLCWDAIGQIEQVLGGSGYSTHHPLAHTLLMGGLVKGGQVLFHSPEMGLFLYMILQDMLLAGALAGTIAVLSKRGAGFGVLLCILLLYCITPVYSNMASTAIKDVPYAAFVTGYVICLALVLEMKYSDGEAVSSGACQSLQCGIRQHGGDAFHSVSADCPLSAALWRRNQPGGKGRHSGYPGRYGGSGCRLQSGKFRSGEGEISKGFLLLLAVSLLYSVILELVKKAAGLKKLKWLT